MTDTFSWPLFVMAGLLLAGCGSDEAGSATSADQGSSVAASTSTPDVVQQLEQARVLNEQGQSKQAVAICNEIIQTHPKQIDAFLLRAQTHIGLSQSDLAMKDVQTAEQLGADAQQLAVLRARIFVAAEEFLSAEQSFTVALSHAPDDAKLYEERAMVRAVLEQHEAAIADFGEGIRRNPRAANLYRWRAEESFDLGNFSDAFQDLQNAILLEPENPDYFLARAHFRAELGLIDEALGDYQQALTLEDSPFTHYLRGNLHAAVGNSQAALSDLAIATDREPNRAEYYLARANLHLQQQDLDLAKADFAKAIELEPETPNPYLRRAGFLLSQGDVEAAIADLTAAIERDPGLLTALRLRGISLRMAEQYEHAIADFQAALDRGDTIDDTMRAELLYQQGLTYQAGDQHTEAIQKLQEATKLDPQLAAAHFSISMSHGSLMKFEEAQRSLNAAITADPDESEFLLARANLYLAEAKYQEIVEEGNPAATIEKARADFRRAVEVDPEDDSAWYALAVAVASTGNFEESVRCLTTAIRLNPEDARYHQARGDIHLKRQQYGAAIDDFSAAIDRSPSPDLYESRGFAYGELGKKPEAIDDYTKAEELTAANPQVDQDAEAADVN